MSPPAPAARGWNLATLHKVPLDPLRQALMDAAKATCGGAPHWRARKLAEAYDLAALSQVNDRVSILRLDLTADFRAQILLRAPVPCLADPQGPLHVAANAHLNIIYREPAILFAQPGYSFVQILAPRHVWLANASHDIHQVLCLGVSIPAGTPVRELIYLTYGALTLQTAQFDPGNFAGVMNLAAAQWWQANVSRIPLSSEPFLIAK